METQIILRFLFFRAQFGQPGATLAPNWAILEPSWPTLGPQPDKSLAYEQITDVICFASRFASILEPKLSSLEPNWINLGAKLRHLGAKLGHLGVQAK